MKSKTIVGVLISVLFSMQLGVFISVQCSPMIIGKFTKIYLTLSAILSFLFLSILLYMLRKCHFVCSQPVYLQNAFLSRANDGKLVGRADMEEDNAMNTEEDSYSQIFLRLKDYFEQKRPYLNSNLSITDVARCIYTNKVYLSRSINIYAGTNFCQYVNFYRIKYALQLFRENPDLRITDVSYMSGFHTTTTFTMAFKLYVNITPREWLKKNRKEE